MMGWRQEWRWRRVAGAVVLLAMAQPTTTMQMGGAGLLVDVMGTYSTRWPCCEPSHTGVFASVVGSAAPGSFAIEFDRPMRPREDLAWSTQVEVFDGQTLTLSSSEKVSPPPTWGHGYLVRGGGILSLTRLSMGGDVRVQADASLNISGCIFTGRHSLYMDGGHIRISDFSELKAPDGMVVLGGIDSFSVLNSTVHMDATTAGGGPTGASIVLSGSEFQRWSLWAQSTAGASTRQFADLVITLEEALAESAGFPAGTIIGTVNSEYDDAVICTRAGWTGSACLEDIDECVDEENENGGCHQVCVNTPGSHHCECSDGYRLISGSETQCEDIDECELQGCAPGNLARDCRGGNATTPEINRCEHFCTNFEGTFQCSCDPGLSLKGVDPYSCHDLNECMDEGVWGDPCIEIPHAKCDNLFGRVQCLCDPGYEASDSGGEILLVIMDGDVMGRNGTECSEVGGQEQLP